MAAIGVDLPYARVVQAQLQLTADAAAHAATAQLDGTDAGLDAARSAAISIAAQNRAAGRPVTLAPEQITLGVYEGGAFTPSAVAEDVNAVRVDAAIPELGLLFAPVAFRRSTVAVGGRSAMVHEEGPARDVDCFLPLALSSCLVDRWTRDGLQDVTLQSNPAGIDNVGWASIGGSASAHATRQQLQDCRSFGTASVGDPVYLQNGSVNVAYTEVVAQIRAGQTRWSTTRWGAQPTQPGSSAIPAADWGHTLEGVVIVFDGGEEYCEPGGGSFNGVEPIVGFVWGAVYDVWGGNSTERRLQMRLDVLEDHRVGRNGVADLDLGLTAWAPPRMVAAN